MHMHRHGADTLSKVRRYLDRDLWTADTSTHRLAGRLAIRLLRLVIVVVRAPVDTQLNLEATALVYRTLLSIVPLLAVAFSVLKGFGAQYRIEPVLVQMLTPLGEGGAEIAARIVGFVSNLNVSVLGIVGVIGLFYTVVGVIEKVEDALNRIWHARRSRSLMRKLLDGVFTRSLPTAAPVFHALPAPTDAEVAEVLDQIYRRARRLLRRRGRWPEEEASASDPVAEQLPLLAEYAAASIQEPSRSPPRASQ